MQAKIAHFSFVAFLAAGFASHTTLNAQNVSNGPAIRIDLASLPPEVLNCNVCRMRLGLSPIAGGGTTDFAVHDAMARSQSASSPNSQTSKQTVPTPASNGSNPASSQSAEMIQPESVLATPSSTSSSLTAPKNLASDLMPPLVVPATQQPSAPNLQTNDALETQNLNSQATSSAESNRLSQFSSLAEAQRSAAAANAANKSFDDATPGSDLSLRANALLNSGSGITGSPTFDTRFQSPASMQIELELAKKQLAERNNLIEQFNANQSKLESQISQLSTTNRQYETALQSRSKVADEALEKLRKQSSESSKKLATLQKELDAKRRELSIAQAESKMQSTDSNKQTQAAQEDLLLRANQADARSAEAEKIAESMRRQRDGLQRELSAMSDQLSKAKEDLAANSPTASSDQELRVELKKLTASRDRLLQENMALQATVKEAEQAVTAAKDNDSPTADAVMPASSDQLDELRVQLEQQAATFMQAQSQWDSERDALIQELTQVRSGLAVVPPVAAASQLESSKAVAETPKLEQPMVTSQSSSDLPASDPTSEPTALPADTGIQSDPAAPASRVGPKTPSRAPRQQIELPNKHAEKAAQPELPPAQRKL